MDNTEKAFERQDAENAKLQGLVEHNKRVADQAMKDREAAIVERDGLRVDLQRMTTLAEKRQDDLEASNLLVEALRIALEHEAKGNHPCGPDCEPGGYVKCIGCDERASAALREASSKRKCPSTYTHTSDGKLECEKDEAHLHRIGDVEHRKGRTVWFSL